MFGVGHAASSNAAVPAPVDVAVVVGAAVVGPAVVAAPVVVGLAVVGAAVVGAAVVGAIVVVAELASSSSPHAALDQRQRRRGRHDRGAPEAAAAAASGVRCRRRGHGAPSIVRNQSENGFLSAAHTVPGAGVTRSTKYFTRAASMHVLWSLSLRCP